MADWLTPTAGCSIWRNTCKGLNDIDMDLVWDDMCFTETFPTSLDRMYNESYGPSCLKVKTSTKARDQEVMMRRHTP